jgi:hypothetical protein
MGASFDLPTRRMAAFLLALVIVFGALLGVVWLGYKREARLSTQTTAWITPNQASSKVVRASGGLLNDCAGLGEQHGDTFRTFVCRAERWDGSLASPAGVSPFWHTAADGSLVSGKAQ